MICSGDGNCGAEKPASEFYSYLRTMKDGRRCRRFHNLCKPCARKAARGRQREKSEAVKAASTSPRKGYTTTRTRRDGYKVYYYQDVVGYAKTLADADVFIVQHKHAAAMQHFFLFELAPVGAGGLL